MAKLGGVPNAGRPLGTWYKSKLRGYSKRVRTLIGRGIEVAQWGRGDTHAKPMKVPLRGFRDRGCKETK